MNEIKINLDKILNSIKSWPTEEVKQIEDKEKAIELTDIHFQKIEQQLTTTLNAINNLDKNERIVFKNDIEKLKMLIEEKFTSTEQELKEIKTQLDSGRTHAKAIKAYSRI